MTTNSKKNEKSMSKIKIKEEKSMSKIPEGRVRHQMKISQIDGEDRELEIKVDSTYSRLDEFVEALLNDPDSVESLKSDPAEFLADYGITFGSEISASDIRVPDVDALRRARDKSRADAALQPGVVVSPRASTGVALVEVAVAISLFVSFS